MTYTCPVSGFDGLTEPPRTPKSGGGCYEICPSCGFEFGVSDEDLGYTYERWRDEWVRRGMPWDGAPQMPAPGWDADAQIRSLLGRTINQE